MEVAAVAEAVSEAEVVAVAEAVAEAEAGRDAGETEVVQAVQA